MERRLEQEVAGVVHELEAEREHRRAEAEVCPGGNPGANIKSIPHRC